jgi:prevent-host-death family protein
VKQTVVGIYEAKTHLSKYVRRVAAGEEELIISSAGKPLVKMVTYTPPSSPRKPGLLKGKLVVKPGFDDLPPGFEDFADTEAR